MVMHLCTLYAFVHVSKAVRLNSNYRQGNKEIEQQERRRTIKATFEKKKLKQKQGIFYFQRKQS